MAEPEPQPSGDDPPPRDPSRLHIWQIQAVRDALLILLILAALRLGYVMSAITVPLLIALLLAYLFEPLIALLQNRLRWSRTTAVALILAFFICGVVTVAVPVSLVVVGQSVSFAQNATAGKYANALDKGIALLPEGPREQVQDAVHWLEVKAPWSAKIFGDEVPQPPDRPAEPEASPDTGRAGTLDGVSEREIQTMIAQEVARQLAERDGEKTAAEETKPWSFGSSALGLVGAGAKQVWSLAIGTIEIALLIFLVPFYFFFFATAFPNVVRFGRSLVPVESRERIFHLVGSMDRAVSGFVRGRLVISAILGMVFAIGWLIVGVPYALALGLLIGVLCVVPYLSAVGVPIAIALLAVDQFGLEPGQRMAWWGILLWPTVVYGLGQTLDDWVLTPLIQGKTTDLHPVSIVVAVLAGGALAGVYGMLLAVPLAACVKIMLREVVMPRVRAWSSGEAQDPLPGRVD